MRAIAIALLISIAASSTVAAQPDEATIWKQVAASIPLGSKVKAETNDGRRYSGTLMRAGEDGILVKKNTRIAEPGVTIAYKDLGKLERDRGNGGMGVAKAIGVGVAAGAGIFLGMLAIAVSSLSNWS